MRSACFCVDVSSVVCLRKNDAIFRYAGELFAGVDHAAIMAVAHRYELHDLVQVCLLKF